VNSLVVCLATVVAVVTDLRTRTICRGLTIPVFLFGLAWTAVPLTRLLPEVACDRRGMSVLVGILWTWLGPSLLVAVYSIFLFWLGIIDGGDGQFLIAITPWCGGSQMLKILWFFYPAAFGYLFFYLLYQYRFDLKALLEDQVRDFVLLLRCWPVVWANIKNCESQVLVNNIPYSSGRLERPPGMVAIGVAVLLGLFCR